MRVCNRAQVVLIASLTAAGCGGGDPAPPPGTPATQPAGTPLTDTAMGMESQAAAPPGVAVQEPQEEPPQQETQLVREVFSYRGSGRDPFMSLLRSGDVRPLLDDLRVTTITYNARFPSNSVAVLRDTTVNQRYTVRIGDEVGRIRVVEIRPREVVVVVEEFGAERQVVLTQRRRQEGLP